MEPFEEPFWNLMQTLAWAYLGDRSMVAKCADGVTQWGTFRQPHSADGERRLPVFAPHRLPGHGPSVAGGPQQGRISKGRSATSCGGLRSPANNYFFAAGSPDATCISSSTRSERIDTNRRRPTVVVSR